MVLLIALDNEKIRLIHEDHFKGSAGFLLLALITFGISVFTTSPICRQRLEFSYCSSDYFYFFRELNMGPLLFLAVFIDRIMLTQYAKKIDISTA